LAGRGRCARGVSSGRASQVRQADRPVDSGAEEEPVMSKLVAIFENSQRLALIAVEEAQRFGHPAVDVEHLFLALALSETAAGISLREAGVTIDDARE